MSAIPRRLLVGTLAGLFALAVAWAAGAIWVDGPASRAISGTVVLIFLVGVVAALWLRPAYRAFAAVAVMFALVLAWWLAIPASNDRDWLDDVSRTPRATLDGNRLTIQNVRNFRYRSDTDFDPRWETRTFDLDQLQGVSLFLSYWGPRNIAHTLVSWEFATGPPLIVSIETRKEKGEEYSALLGFFRQFELYYVVADEQDLIGVRAGPRGEEVFLYPTRLPPERARALLLDYVAEINRLADRPEWYNALTQNCTTGIRHHMQNIGGARPWDWRILANGHVDELLYQNGTIDTSLPFVEVRARSDVTARAQAALGSPDFSARLRDGLPVAAAPPGS